MGGKGYKPYTSLTGKKVSGDWEDSDRGSGNKSTRRSGGEVKVKSPTYLAHVHNKAKKKVDPKKNPDVKEDYYRGTGEKVVARTKKWMDKKGQKGAPGLDAMKARAAEHKAKQRVIGEEGSHGEKVDGKFMSYATMKAKGIKPKRTAVQNVINNTIRPAQGKPTGQKRSDYDARHKHMDRKESPKATVTKGREQKARADAAMRDTRGT